jgi:hypothetical protein
MNPTAVWQKYFPELTRISCAPATTKIPTLLQGNFPGDGPNLGQPRRFRAQETSVRVRRSIDGVIGRRACG